MNINCLVKFWFFLAFAISVLLTDSIAHWAVLFAFYLVIILSYPRVIPPLWIKLKPYLIYLPFMVILYIGFSLLMTTDSFAIIFRQGGFAFIKLFLMIAIMSVYFQISNSESIIKALRSLWVKTGLKWRFVDDFFIYLELTLRFFPTFQRDWDFLRQSRRSLGLLPAGGRLSEIRQTASDLPGLLFQSLRRADEIALSIRLRGYGTVLPRGVADPLEFNTIDGITMFFVTVLFCWSNFVIAI